MSARPRRRMLVVLACLLAVAGTVGIASRSKRTARRAEAAIDDGAERRRGDHLSLPQRSAASAALKTVKVERTTLAGDIQVVGSVAAAEDHFAVVGPSVSGRVVRLHVGVGDPVKKGQILAEIESVEAGQARGEYIAAKAAFAAAEANAVREKELAEKQNLLQPRTRGRRRAGRLATRQDASGPGAPARDRLRSPRGSRAGTGRRGRAAHPLAGPDRRHRHHPGCHAGSIRRAIDGCLHDREPCPPVGLARHLREGPRARPSRAAGEPSNRRRGRGGVQGPCRLRRSCHRPEDTHRPRAGGVREHGAQVPAEPAGHRPHHWRQRARRSARSGCSERRRPARRRHADRVRETRATASSGVRSSPEGPAATSWRSVPGSRKARRSRWRERSCSRASSCDNPCWTRSSSCRSGAAASSW